VNVQTLLHDLRYALRILRKSPAFTMIAVSTVAIGLGANTAIFAAIRALVLQPLPFQHSDKIVRLWEEDKNRAVERGLPSPAAFLDWRDRTHTFAEMSAWRTWFCTLTGQDNSEQVWGVRTSTNFFRLLGVEPAMGRAFLNAEEQPGHDGVVILSHSLFQRRYHGDEQLIGKAIDVDGKALTVIGVLPPSFSLFGTSRSYDLWMPFAVDRASLRRDDHSIMVFARVKDEFSLLQAQSEMTTVAEQMVLENPEMSSTATVRLTQFRADQTGRLQPLLLILALTSIVVLLVACANVANMLLSHGLAREHELAVRVALGAKQGQLVRQLLTESVLIALAGGILGLCLASVTLRILPAVLPTTGTEFVPYVSLIRIDAQVLGFASASALVTGLIFGLLPALEATRVSRKQRLQIQSRNPGYTTGRRHVRSLLIGSQVALSVVLLVGAGLLVHSFVIVLRENLGFNSHNALTMQIWLSESRYPDEGQVKRFWEQALPRIAALPGVHSVSTVNFLPLSGWGDLVSYDLASHVSKGSNDQLLAQYRIVAPDYFRTMGMALRRGRELGERDSDSSPAVAVISANLAQRTWPDQDPIGKQVWLEFSQAAAPWRPRGGKTRATVVGVVGEVREWEWAGPQVGTFYLSFAQFPSRLGRLVVRSETDPLSLTPLVKQQLWSVDKDVPVSEVKSMDEFVSEAVSDRRLNAFLPAILAAIALALAAAGIYAVVSCLVVRRTYEIGVRFALGAQSRDVLKLLMLESATVVGWGLPVGCVAASLVSRLLKGFVYGVTTTDVATWAAVLTLVAGSALLATYVPARRATKVDPMVALRYE
jgi:putative ABC transport system permease protein